MMWDDYLEGQIENKYNAEFDVPAEPQVTWVDMNLLELIRKLQARIEKLEKRLDDQEQVLKDAATLAAGESLV